MVHDLCGTVTGFVGDSLPRTGRGWWRWFRWQREQQRKLHGLVCSAPAVWPVPNGQPQAGDLIHRTDKRKVLLCSTGESTPWDRPQRKARYKCTHMCKRGTALWQRPHNTARVSQAAAKNKSLSVRSFHTRGRILCTFFEANLVEPCHPALLNHHQGAGRAARNPRVNSGRASRSLLRFPPASLRNTVQSSSQPSSFLLVNVFLGIRAGLLCCHCDWGLLTSSCYQPVVLAREKTIDPRASASCSAQHLHRVLTLFFHLVLLGF